jgi:hypothetical protein
MIFNVTPPNDKKQYEPKFEQKLDVDESNLSKLDNYFG